jgi:hypothetical protein
MEPVKYLKSEEGNRKPEQLVLMHCKTRWKDKFCGRWNKPEGLTLEAEEGGGEISVGSLVEEKFFENLL